MKLHLPVKLFRALMALALIAPFTSQAGVIPADYTLQWGDSVETVMKQSESAEDIAFIVNTDLAFSGDSPVASGESGSRLFIDKANDDIAQKLSFSGFTSKLFDLESNLAFTDLNTLTIRNNHQNTDERYAYASVNASSISIDNVQHVDISSNVLFSVEDDDAYAMGAALNGDVKFRACGDVNLSENQIEVGSWDNYHPLLESIAGAAIYGSARFEDNNDISIGNNRVYAYGATGSIYGGAIDGEVAFINNRDVVFEYNDLWLNVYNNWYSCANGGALIGHNENILFEKNRNVSFRSCSASVYLKYGTSVYAQGGAV